MKFKLPRILSFKVLLDEYSSKPARVVLKGQNTFHILFEEDDSAEKKREAILNVLKKHEKALREIETAMVAYAREMTIDSPQISLMKVKKRSNMDEHEYYNARVMFPEYDGKYTEYRVYLGSTSNYPNVKDPQTLASIKEKIVIKIKEKRGHIYPDGKYK